MFVKKFSTYSLFLGMGLLFTTNMFSVKKDITKIKITSPSFNNNDFLPNKHTYDGQNLSPALSWSKIPNGTKSIAILCDDPDAARGTFAHWIIFNISPQTASIPEGIPHGYEITSEPTLKNAHQGLNDLGHYGFDGAHPPFGVHRYIFKIYALKEILKLNEKTTKDDFLNAISGNLLGYGELTSKFGKEGEKELTPAEKAKAAQQKKASTSKPKKKLDKGLDCGY
jgi:Raf kinase inhibitor-like YbhB/YbcL family protein